MEMVFGMVILAIIMTAFTGIFVLFQRSSAQARKFVQAQQNARVAVDFATEFIRQAGANTDYGRGQKHIVHGGPYQIAINADIDNSQVIGGLQPLAAYSLRYSPNTAPPSGTTLYSPPQDYDSPAETIILTLDSNSDGVVNTSDHGDDAVETGPNSNLFVLKTVTYGANLITNVVRSADLALVRGGAPYPDTTHPQPLFAYFYDHDNDRTTPLKLWGDDNPENGSLGEPEVVAMTAVPDSLLGRIRKVRVNVTAESKRYDAKFADTGGFLSVTMKSEVSVRNASRVGSLIYGQVFQDADSDGILDPGETGIPNVEVRISALARGAVTSGTGFFSIPVPPGTYAVKEIDNPGYNSTTPNVVTVPVGTGDAVQVNYGDRWSSPIGFIKGNVYDDLNQNGVKDMGEAGIPSVLLTLDTGELVYTAANGNYSFAMPLGNYVLVESDPVGWGSTTPNSYAVNLIIPGDSLIFDFGDSANPGNGTIQGFVFLDQDLNGVRDLGEEGIPNVSLSLSNGDSSLTNAGGHYEFSVAPGVYNLTEIDIAGYLSTSVNSIVGIPIVPDTIVNYNFGDILDQSGDFVEIEIRQAEQALTVRAVNLQEDVKSDLDIILGTPRAGAGGNMLVFHNKWQNVSTAPSQLFDSLPNFTRDATEDVNTLSIFDLNLDGLPDIISGLEQNTAPNVQIWNCQAGGLLGTTPDSAYITTGSTVVRASKLADLNNDGRPDIIVGLKNPSGSFSGGFQTFIALGGKSFVPGAFISTAGTLGALGLGEIWTLDTGDLDKDGDLDVVVGSHDSDFTGFIDVYENVGAGILQWAKRLRAPGAVNELDVLEMNNNNLARIDIIAAVTTATNQGGVFLWLQADSVMGVAVPPGSVYGKKDTITVFGPEEDPRGPSDLFVTTGEAISLKMAFINQDIFPDVLVGTRTSVFNTGDVHLLITFGTLPSTGKQLNTTSTGEVTTIDAGDFDKNSWVDILVGTRISATQGKLVIYFNDPTFSL